MLLSKKTNVNFAPYLCSDGFETFSNMDLLEEIILKDVWSPIVWRDGVRKSDHFLSSDFLVLDFDKKEIGTMDDLDFLLRDYKRVIATTKSHMKNYSECFRLIIPFDQTITDLETYKYNLKLALEKIPGADPACKDGARFFFPSKQIMRIERDESCANWLVTQSVSSVPFSKTPNDKLPKWILGFINQGYLPENNSRNCSLFRVLIWFAENGFDLNWVQKTVKKAPIDWNGVNLEATMKSVKNKTARN